ncbi:hypothetical protein IHE45_04G107600 [Dioscorea alata]|uniref:Uncharacterized protein n=1 Tax=Dioscorea alata TaxID=55571 RepID=A0ACB7WFJ6_DIOAL|nr:hypothetical protein IHE45_04G107600 [Dioscorea alata]
MERGQLQTLATPPERMRTPSQFSIPRSHLDCVTYRALVRILSVCLDSSPNPSESPSDENHRCGADRVEVLEESLPSGNGCDGRCMVSSDGLGHGIELEEKEMTVISKDSEGDGRVDREVREGSIADCAGLVDLAVDVRDEVTNSGENPSLLEFEKRVSGGQEKQEWHNASDGFKGFGEDENRGSALVIWQDRMLCPSEFGSETLVDALSKEVALAVSGVGQGKPQEQLNVSDGSKDSVKVRTVAMHWLSRRIKCFADVGSKKVALVVSDVRQGKPQEQLNVCNGPLMVCEGENNGNSVGSLLDQMLFPSEFDNQMVVDVGSKELALVVDEVGQGKPQKQFNVRNGSLMVCEGKSKGNVSAVSQNQMPCPSEVGSEMVANVASKELALAGEAGKEKPQEQHIVNNESPMICEGENTGNLLIVSEDGTLCLSEVDGEMMVDVRSKELGLEGKLWQEKPHEQHDVSNASAEVYEGVYNTNKLVILHDQMSRLLSLVVKQW